jgi:succinyl-diaminopimelate desuccinylase
MKTHVSSMPRQNRRVNDVADRLAERTLALVDIPSVSGSEQAIAGEVERAMPWKPARRDGEALWYERRESGRPLVILAGHLDTVPAQDNLPGRREDRHVVGLGASDMKGGLAVMIEFARWLAAAPAPALDFGFLFFPREELPASENPLPALFDAWPELTQAELAILLEPTDGAIHAGCLGHLHARVVVEGRSAHSARPWLGENAIDRALERLAPLAAAPPRDAVIDGLTFREVASLTEIHGGIAVNVVPDRVEATVSYRYAPDRTPEAAEAELRRLAGDFEVIGNSPAGRVVVAAPLVQRLARAAGAPFEPKQAWTNVADFTSRGVDAVNFGPGATRYAHTRDERVEIAALVHALEALQRFAGDSV